MLRAFFRRKPKSPSRRNNVVQKGRSPRRNSAIRGLRGIVAAKRGGHRWATRARRAINNRGRPAAAQSPRRRNNNVMVVYNGKIMTIKGMEQQKQYKRLLNAGVPNNVAWKRVGGRSIYN